MKTALRTTVSAQLVVLLVLLASCGGDNKDDQATPDRTSTTTTTSASASTPTSPDEDGSVSVYCLQVKEGLKKVNLRTRTGFAKSVKLLRDIEKVTPKEVAAPTATVLAWIENVAKAPTDVEFVKRYGTQEPDVSPAFAELLDFQKQHC